MSQPFDDLYDQVQGLQDTSDTNQSTLDSLSNAIQPDGTIRAQLDYPLDDQSTQEIQEVISSTGGTVTVGTPTTGQYSSAEYDNNTVSTSATIDWSKGNVQYVTLSGATTFSFANPLSGGRYVLHVAGAYTPTFPSNVRWPSATTPTATATSGHKDLYTFIYSAKESLYDGIQAANFATT